jgi:hypothetical protein
MSAPPHGTGQGVAEHGDPAQATGISVSSRLIRLDPGMFSLSLAAGPGDRGGGLPGVRVCAPPGPSGRRDSVTIGTLRNDGWMTPGDESTLLRVPPGGGEVLVTLYWSAADGAGAPPLKLDRLHPEGGAPAAGTGLAAAVPHGNPARAVPAAPPAEVIAHIEGIGDVDGRFGDWIGMRGSGRAIEGFSLNPRQGITNEDFDLRAVLGRDWLSPWLPGTNYCGSRGLALPLRGFCLRLRPAAMARFDTVCFGRFVDGSEAGPIGGDGICVAPSLAALEAFQVVLRPRTG